MKLLLINRSSFAAGRRGAVAGLVLAAVLGGLPGAAQAQTKPPKKKTGNIEAAEIEIVKERINQLPEATRNYDKIKLPAPPQTERKVTYTFPDFRLPADRLNPSVRVLTIRAEEPEPLNGKFVKLGIGNYGTFYGRGYLHSTRTEDSNFAYGVDIKHVNSLNGPVDGKNSGVSQSSASLMGEMYKGTTALGATIDYGRERYNFYGYDQAAAKPEKDNIKQVFNRFAVKAYARNQDPEQTLQYDAGIGFKHWGDEFSAKENNFTINGKVGYALGETSRVTLAADASFISSKDSLVNRSRTFVQATPAYELTKDRLSVTIGATIGYSSDTVNNVGKTTINPAVRVGYVVAPEKFMVYVGAGGAIQRVTLYDLSTENPWLNCNLNVADTHRGPTGYIGFNSTPVRGLELNARATYGRDKNLYFYLNNPNRPDKFDLVYDSATTQFLNVHGEVLYNAAEKLRIGTRLDYNKYMLETLAQPFHRPEFQGSVFATYNVFDKLLLGVEAYFYSASYGISYATVGGAPVPDFYRGTDAIYDLNLRADYRVTPKISIFVMGNNLANQQYQRFYRYPTKGINALGGATYTF
jgi:hypothetical protein